MIRILKVAAPTWLVLLFGFETLLLFSVFHAALTLTWVQFDFSAAQFLQYAPKSLLFVGTTILLMFAFGLYRREAVVSGSAMLPRLVIAFTAALLLLALFFYSLPGSVIWRSVLAIAMPMGFAGIVIARRFGRGFFDSHLLKRRIAVLGAGEQAARIEALHRRAFPGFTCLGYLRIDSEEVRVSPSRLLGPTNDVAELLRGKSVEEIVIATSCRKDLPTRALVDCRLSGMKISDYENFYGRETGRIDLDFLMPDWFFVEEGFHAAPLDRWSKRLVDLVLSGLCLLISMPLFLLIAIAIKLEDGGPVFYRQERVGLAGRPFRLTKFRSMRLDAEPDGVPRWTVRRDTRVTHVGQFLRVTHLDELPQLWSIAKGEMSFVGPRPERPFFVQQLAEAHPYFQDRHAVKPGLTGWAQINLPYASTAEEARKKLEYDLYYVRYGNTLLDAVIMVQTLRVMLWPSAAHATA
jgi:sugar transferase (PEP-CTERM system associated)